MPRIEHIIGQGPELTESQSRVLEVLEKHPTHLFRLYGDDMREIQRWITAPEDDEPPLEWDKSLSYSLDTIRWALKTLHGRKKIRSIVKHKESYYGSHEAVKRAEGYCGITETIIHVHDYGSERRLAMSQNVMSTSVSG